MVISIVNANDGDIVQTEAQAYRRLLSTLDEHRLKDSSFLAARWLRPATGDGWVRLIACQGMEFVGFLAGRCTGHISILGVVEPRRGAGSALLNAFAGHVRRCGAVTDLTVAIDSEPVHRWDRRQFFVRHGFVAVGGSAVHFTKRLP